MDHQEYLIDLLINLVESLKTRECDFALIGGLAFSALVEPRATMDVDMLIAIDQIPDMEVLKGLEEVFDEVIPQEKVLKFKNARIWRIVGTRDGREIIVDLMLADEDYYKEVLKRKNNLQFEDHSIPVITLEDLYILKSIAGRLQDQADIEKMERSLSESLDKDYIQKWLKQFNVK